MTKEQFNQFVKQSLDEKVECIRCKGNMIKLGTEHRVYSRHFGQVLLDLWACTDCPYMEYRRRKPDPNKIETPI